MFKKSCGIWLFACIVLFGACATEHKVEVAPVEVKPIHITIDVNIRVDRALDSFFDDIDKAAEKEMDKIGNQEKSNEK